VSTKSPSFVSEKYIATLHFNFITTRSASDLNVFFVLTSALNIIFT